MGAAFYCGFAFGDLVTYIPLLVVGLSECWLRRLWARVVSGMALGTTVYWPVVSLAAVVAERRADEWNLPNETAAEFVNLLSAANQVIGEGSRKTSAVVDEVRLATFADHDAIIRSDRGH